MSQQGPLPPAYVALALVVLKSRPSNLTIDDYVRSLRRSFSLSTKVAELNKADDVVEKATDWHEMYQQSQTDLSQLELKVLDLKAQLQSASSSAGTKRKRDSRSDGALALEQSKKARTEVTTLPEQPPQTAEEQTKIAIISNLSDLARNSGAPLDQLAVEHVVPDFGGTRDDGLTASKPNLVREMPSIFAACKAAVIVLQTYFGDRDPLNEYAQHCLAGTSLGPAQHVEACKEFGDRMWWK